MSLENSNYNVKPKAFEKEIEVPYSKSYGNRILILASLKKEAVTIENLPTSSDVDKMISCLEKLGLEVLVDKNTIEITNSFPACEVLTNKPVVLETGDGGTTNRFLSALLSLGQNEYHLRPTEKMIERPMDEMWRVLALGNVKVQKKSDYWSIKGPFQFEGVIEVDCSETTQILSGLHMAFSNNKKVSIKPLDLSASKKYYEMTEVLINKINESSHFAVPIDFSSLGYPLALAAVLGNVKVTNFLEIDHFQPDSILISILRSMGANVKMSEREISVTKPDHFLNSISMDCSPCPDLVPTLAFVCSYANGVSELSGLEILKHKESDRVQGILECLTDFKIPHKYDEQNHILTIQGLAHSKKAEFIECTPKRDHRMIMMTYMFMRANSGGLLHNADCVDKSFSKFYEVID
tara:strand:+ start:88423 stop:89646 length:1224 start_codon:yes stop_codon:yes gene_type:complete